MIDLSQVTDITLGSTPVEQIADSLGNVLWSAAVDPSTVYFYVEDISGNNNTLTIKKQASNVPDIEVFYSTDRLNWVSMGTTTTSGITATVPANGKLFLKANTNRWSWGTNLGHFIGCNGFYNAGGNIMSLLYGDNFQNKNTFETFNTFNSFFRNSVISDNKLVNANKLILPATTLTQSCYQQMFSDNYYLLTAPVLPATTLAYDCYNRMFEGCTALTTAPVLPATTLAVDCYYNMFYGCTSLTTPPALPATTLAIWCYGNMFEGCTSLTTAPVLPATTLADGCYAYMFEGCTALNSVTTYATNISASQCTLYWLGNVAATGDFYNLGGATYPSGTSGIPTGWTEHNSL